MAAYIFFGSIVVAGLIIIYFLLKENYKFFLMSRFIKLGNNAFCKNEILSISKSSTKEENGEITYMIEVELKTGNHTYFEDYEDKEDRDDDFYLFMEILNE